MSSLAPVALFAFNRPDHLARTLTRLQANTLAPKTDLFVFSDGPRNADDGPAVAEVRRMLSSVDGFATVTVTEQEHNVGLASSIVDGVTRIVDAHGRVIVIEDDLETHPLTLEYFNRMLVRYQDFPGVFSISGYAHPPDLMPIPDDYPYDVYAIPRMQCWGWATWADRWRHADFAVPDFPELNDSASATAAYTHWIGGDSLRTLRACMSGEKDVWACRWVYTHFKHHAVCLCPTRSLINNFGLDGSGSNCGVSDEATQTLDAKPIEEWSLPPFIHVDPRIFASFMQVMDPHNAQLRAQAMSGAGQLEPSTTERPASAPPAARRSPPPAPSLFARVLYWSVRPGQLVRRIREIRTERHIVELEGQVEVEHERLSAPPTRDIARLGTQYGGWWVPESGLGPQDFVVSAGAGEDISFDLALARRFGCEILVMDPTPRAIAHFEETSRAVRNQQPAPINGSATEFYEASERDIACLQFRPFGLWKRNETLRFFAPANARHVSHSVGNLHGTESGFDAECITLSEALKRESRDRLTILKIDIEGAEFDVLDDMLAAGLRPQYLLVEYHPGKSELERRARPRTLASLRRLHAGGYRVIKRDGWDYVLELQG